MIQTKRLAACAMMTALSVVLMAVGAILELGTYASPMLASLCLLPVGEKYGRKWQTLVWIASALLSILLIPAPEQNLMYFGLFGWYPIFRPLFQRLPRLLRLPGKLLALNAVMIAIEALVMLVLVPEVMEPVYLIVFLILMNVLFLVYDYALPYMEVLLGRILKYL